MKINLFTDMHLILRWNKVFKKPNKLKICLSDGVVRRYSFNDQNGEVGVGALMIP